MTPYGRQSISQDDIAAVVKVLESDFLTQGPVVPQFEEEVARYCGVSYGVAMNSATSALHVACMALGLRAGDLLWTVPNTFVASANCARYCGADVDFVDIDPVTWNMDVRALEKKLEHARIMGRLPKIVIPVHFAGQSCDMKGIAVLAKRFGFSVIEDASHAIGGSYAGKPIGNCEYSDITIFSFHPVKIITTAEGGMAMTRDEMLAHRMRELRSHGITRDVKRMHGESHGSWYYQQIELGYNYRMTEIQAALGISQMSRLDEFVTKRRELAKRYDFLFADNKSIQTPGKQKDAEPAWHLYVVRIGRRIRRQVFDAMRAMDVGVNIHYIPVHTQPYYINLGFKQGDFPEAEAYYSQAITLPLYTDMTKSQQETVVSSMRKALEEFA